MEIATYAALLNRKLLIPSSKKPYIGADEHFIADLLRPWLEKIHVDEDWYLRAHPDVMVAIQSGAVAGAKAHYCKFGYYEHRMPYEITVDEAWYLKEYPDVEFAVRAKHFTSGQLHFNQIGYREGRFPFAGFTLRTDR